MGPSLPLMWISYAVAGSGGSGLRCGRTQHFAGCDAELRVDDLQELDDVSQQLLADAFARGVDG
eukprot:1067120-Rhodomonas_salina.1